MDTLNTEQDIQTTKATIKAQKKDLYKLSSTWMIYTQENSSSQPYVEIASITKTGLLTNRKPLSAKRLSRFCDSIKRTESEQALKGVIPRNLLYLNSDHYHRKLIWYTNPGVKKLHFTIKGVETGMYPVPGLLWSLSAGHLTIYSFPEWKENETKLYLPPFPNVRPGVCLGSKGQNWLDAQLKTKTTFVEYMEAAEYIFYNTAFSEATENTVTPMNVLYPTLLNKKVFPRKELIKHVVKVKGKEVHVKMGDKWFT